MWQPEMMPIRNVFFIGAAAFFSPILTAFWYISGGGFTEGALATAGAAATAPAPATSGRVVDDIFRAVPYWRCGALVWEKVTVATVEAESDMAPGATKASEPQASTNTAARSGEKPIMLKCRWVSLVRACT